MDKFLAIVVVCILTIAGGFWMYNNNDGMNDGMENGARSINTKMTDFDYSGTTAPGTANHAGDWVATPATND